MTDRERIASAARVLLTSPVFAPLVQWWELSLANAALPPGPVDPYRLAMAQGDRERLLSLKQLAAGAPAETLTPADPGEA